MAEAGREWEFSLCYVEGRFGVAEATVVQPGDVLERRVAHRGVVSIDIQRSHLRDLEKVFLIDHAVARDTVKKEIQKMLFSIDVALARDTFKRKLLKHSY